MSRQIDIPRELAEAQRLDGIGEHHQAVDCLARATQAGSIEAMTQLATRLLAGDRAPRLPAQGAGLLVDAARGGGPQAAARLAVLLGLGAYMPQNWGAAFDALGLAAERGWEPARHQLRTLLPDHRLTLEAQQSNQWRRLAAEVAQAESRWPAAAASPWPGSPVHTVPKMLSQPLCDWLIERSHGKLTRARVYDANAGTDVVHPTRANTAAVFNLMDAEFIHVLVQWRMSRVCGLPIAHMEPLTILHYATGEEVRNHFDFVDPESPHYAQELARNGQRRITFLIYLNEGFTGGETDFPELGIRYKGATGDGLLFVNSEADDQPNLRMLHAGLPPSQGEKWLASQFVRSRRTIG